MADRAPPAQDAKEGGGSGPRQRQAAAAGQGAPGLAPLSPGSEEDADGVAAGLLRIDAFLQDVERQLCATLHELATLRRRGGEVEALEMAVSGAVGCLRERSEARGDGADGSEASMPMDAASGTGSKGSSRHSWRYAGEDRKSIHSLRHGSACGSLSRELPQAPAQGPLLGLCNPLLDMSLRVDAEFLSSYDLAPDGWAAATEDTTEIFPLLAQNPMTQYIPGGSGLNTLRVAQWVLEAPGATVFLGTTGQDEFGSKLHAVTEADGVHFPDILLEGEPTGTCAVLLSGDSRSLVANLGASGVFDAAWLRDRDELRRAAAAAGLYYVTGFFLRTSPETVADLGAMAAAKGRELALNLSAAFVCQQSVHLFREALPRVDLLFGNAEEARALASVVARQPDPAAAVDGSAAPAPRGDVKADAALLQAFCKYGAPRTVVVTQGPSTVVVATQAGVESYDTAPLPPEQVVDTNGAGDAFAGGFLAKRLRGGTVAECVRVGQWAAGMVIGQAGCTLPSLPASLTAGTPLTDAPFRRNFRSSSSDGGPASTGVPFGSEPSPGAARGGARPSLGSPALKAWRRDAPAPLRRSVVLHSSPLAASAAGPPLHLLGLCNPLLDLSLRVDKSFLGRYGLAENGWAAASAETIGVFAEMEKDPGTEYIAGGSGLNTLRVAQWVLEAPGSTTFLGATGSDEFGSRLRREVEAGGVSFPTIALDDEPTGTCAVLLNGDNRSLVANLGASAVFDSAWLRDRPELRGAAEAAGAYYITGFFLKTSPETVAHLAKIAGDREMCLNLSAPFVCEAFVHLIRDAVPRVDVIFGNSEEALALASALGFDATDVGIVARRLQQLPKANVERPRLIVITQGSGPVVIAKEDGVVTYETAPLPEEQVVDTNGAGDAFAGGFLAKRLQGGSVSECVRVGQWCASIIIGRPGCTLPPFPAGQMPGFLSTDMGGELDSVSGRNPSCDTVPLDGSTKSVTQRIERQLRDAGAEPASSSAEQMPGLSSPATGSVLSGGSLLSASAEGGSASARAPPARPAGSPPSSLRVSKQFALDTGGRDGADGLAATTRPRAGGQRRLSGSHHAGTARAISFDPTLPHTTSALPRGFSSSLQNRRSSMGGVALKMAGGAASKGGWSNIRNALLGARAFNKTASPTGQSPARRHADPAARSGSPGSGKGSPRADST